MIGRIFFRSSPSGSRLEQRLARLHPVDVAAQRVDLAVVGDEAVRMGQRPGRERVGAEPLVHERQRRLERRIGQVREHPLDLAGGQHALVDQRARRQADHVEELAPRQIERVHRVLHPLADDEQLPLERRIPLSRGPRRGHRRPAADQDLPEHRLHRHRARAERAVVGRHVAPPDDPLPFLDDDPLEQLLERRTGLGLLRQEHQARRRSRAPPAAPSPDRAASLRRNASGHLNQDAGAVTGIDLAAARTAVLQVDQDLQRLPDDGVRASALDVSDEPDAAGVVLMSWIVETTSGGLVMRLVAPVVYERRRFHKRNGFIASACMCFADGPLCVRRMLDDAPKTDRFSVRTVRRLPVATFDQLP